MFTTYPAFKLPGFNDKEHGFTNWRMLELLDTSPLFVATLAVTEDGMVLRNTLLITFVQDVLGLLMEQKSGKVKQLHMIKPGSCSSTGEWEIKEIMQVYADPKTCLKKNPPVVFIDSKGASWSGPDMEPADETAREQLELLAELGGEAS